MLQGLGEFPVQPLDINKDFVFGFEIGPVVVSGGLTLQHCVISFCAVLSVIYLWFICSLFYSLKAKSNTGLGTFFRFVCAFSALNPSDVALDVALVARHELLCFSFHLTPNIFCISFRFC